MINLIGIRFFGSNFNRSKLSTTHTRISLLNRLSLHANARTKLANSAYAMKLHEVLTARGSKVKSLAVDPGASLTELQRTSVTQGTGCQMGWQQCGCLNSWNPWDDFVIVCCMSNLVNVMDIMFDQDEVQIVNEPMISPEEIQHGAAQLAIVSYVFQTWAAQPPAIAISLANDSMLTFSLVKGGANGRCELWHQQSQWYLGDLCLWSTVSLLRIVPRIELRFNSYMYSHDIIWSMVKANATWICALGTARTIRKWYLNLNLVFFVLLSAWC